MSRGSLLQFKQQSTEITSMPQIGLFSMLDKSELIQSFFFCCFFFLSPLFSSDGVLLKTISKQKLNYLYLREILMSTLKRSANIKRSTGDGVRKEFLRHRADLCYDRALGFRFKRRVLLPFFVCILPSGPIVSSLVVCC